MALKSGYGRKTPGRKAGILTRQILPVWVDDWEKKLKNFNIFSSHLLNLLPYWSIT